MFRASSIPQHHADTALILWVQGILGALVEGTVHHVVTLGQILRLRGHVVEYRGEEEKLDDDFEPIDPRQVGDGDCGVE